MYDAEGVLITHPDTSGVLIDPDCVAGMCRWISQVRVHVHVMRTTNELLAM